jgi:protein-disulfide isomerase
VHVRHHFPEASLPLFLDASAVECAAAQGRRKEAGDWILAGRPRDEMAAALALDAATFEGCMSAPGTAIDILDDTAEALRLGFVGAVPSWVVAGKVRRGVQGELDLRRVIDAQIRRNGTNDARSGPQARSDAVRTR